MFGIPGPPQPQLSDLHAYGAALGLLIVGVAILLWGRHLGRALLCVAGMGLGLALAGPVAQKLEVSLLTVRIVSAITLGLVGLVLARLIWALLAAVMCGAVAVCFVLRRFLEELPSSKQPIFDEATAATLIDWALGVGKFFLDGLVGLWSGKATLVMAVIGPAVVLPLVVALLRARLGRIVMTSLLGGMALVAGPVLAVVQLRGSFWGPLWTHWYVPLAVAGALAIFALVVQYRGAIRADSLDKDREAEPPDQGKGRDEPKAKKKKT